MAYSAIIARTNPALCVFLVNQSNSKGNNWSLGMTRAEKVAELLNASINKLVHYSLDPDYEVRDFFDISIIGYESDTDFVFEGSLMGLEIVSLTMLNDNPIIVEPRKWVSPKFGKNEANLTIAFRKVSKVVAEWIDTHPIAFPPIIFHITDGEYDGNDPSEEIKALKKLGTDDGKCLLWNIYVSQEADGTLSLPVDGNEVRSPLAQKLFNWASILPYESLRLTHLAKGMRAFSINSDVEDFVNRIRHYGDLDRF